MLSEKKRAYLNAGLAIKECEYKRRSWEHAEEFKGFGTSSSGLIDKAMYEREKVGKTFFTVMNSKGVREAVASLPNDAEITVGTDGVLRVNNGISEDFHARGCTYETELGGVLEVGVLVLRGGGGVRGTHHSASWKCKHRHHTLS